ncbi:MAG: excinuclease ABC subunit UvrC [Nitrospirae bacterium]|nr:excinuclease ABC subunit UvrC [Nitrospirota bacterium]
MLEKLQSVPEKPGVYLFRDSDSKVLYVGKAKALINRLRSYFQKSSSLDPRKTALINESRDFEYTVTGNELEALILEANLIKQYKPRYNILLRDDKSYPYLKLTVNEEWPRLEVVRRIQKDGARYFGPYVPSGPMWTILSFIRNTYGIRTCKYSLEKRMRPCIQHQIRKCVAPCSGKTDRGQYMDLIHEVKLLLEGKNRGLLDTLKKKMDRLSEELRYEEAALVRDRIRAIQKISESQKAVAPDLGDADVVGIIRNGCAAAFRILFIRNGFMIGSRQFLFRGVSDESDGYLLKNFMEQFYGKEIMPPLSVLCSFMPEDALTMSTWLSEKRGGAVKITVPRRGLKRELVAMAEENAEILLRNEQERADTLMNDIAELLHLRNVPNDIGAFDISNISGKEAVGAFVYWGEGNFRKGRYRHVRMDAVKGPDDYAMMKEMVKRTLKNPDNELPDLLIIDGGRAHLEAAAEVLREEKITDREVVGLAKDPDRVFLRDEKIPVNLDDGRPAALLLRRIRDEAHRFAVAYHRKLRSKRVFESPLQKIAGVGKKRRFALLKHFGSIEAVRHSTAEEIASLKGFDRRLAEKILGALS